MQRTRQRPPRRFRVTWGVRRAYTLVELVVVITILGIAGMLLVPNMIDRDTFAIQAASRSIVSDMVFAQSDALANQEYRRFQLIKAGVGEEGYVGYCIVRVTPQNFMHPFNPDTADYIQDPMGTLGADGRYITDFTIDDRFGGVRISSVSIDSGLDYITFDEFGGSVSSSSGAPGTGGEIELSGGDGQRYLIAIAPFTGKTTVEVVQNGP